jgi:hypothetical protein
MSFYKPKPIMPAKAPWQTPVSAPGPIKQEQESQFAACIDRSRQLS